MKRKTFIQSLGLGVMFWGISWKLAATIAVHNDNKCRDAWEKLCGKLVEREGFEYVIPRQGMPKVFLYGDSISMGYTPTVRKELRETADVYRIFRNGESSNEFIANMEKMRKTMFQPNFNYGWDFKWDLIHFNVGLHDLKYLEGERLDKVNGKQVSSISQYKKNLNEIFTYLIINYPDARLIFATTTPVPENEPGRIAGDAVKYNAAAREVLSGFPQIKINDLYAFTKPHFEKWAISPGNVHYNELGMTEQGKEVAKVIKENMKC